MRTLVALVVLAGTAAACSLNYGKDQTPQPDQIPQMVFDGLRQTGVRDGRTLYTMESDGAEVYLTKKQMLLNRFRFQEYDSHGVLASQGEADSAVVETATNDAKINGRLRVRSQEQGVTLEIAGPSGGLTWANEDRILKTEPNTSVRLTKDDGSHIDARAMTLDLGTNKLELEEGVQGTWTPETKDDASKKSPPAASVPDSSLQNPGGRSL